MAVSKSKASSGSKTHNSKPSSKLSKFASYSKPESRELGTKKSVGGADAFIRRIHG